MFDKPTLPTAPVNKKEILDAFEYFLDLGSQTIRDSSLFPKSPNYNSDDWTPNETYVNVALKLTEIYVSNRTNISIERGDVLGHGLYLGINDSLNNIAEALNTKE